MHTKSILTLVLFTSMLGLLACEKTAPTPQSTTPPPSTSVEPQTPSDDSLDNERVHAQPTGSSSSCAPVDDLHAMDNRKPVPLQPMMAWHQKQNMMQHLVAIQQITAAAAQEDWDAVAKASKQIESSPQMQQMCQHMGAGAEGFTDMALEFHARADKIGEAAQKKDLKEVLKATSHTLETCTSCHATYKQHVVDASTWQDLTGSQHKPDPSMHHGHH